jgi:cell cycle arrest protein BUB2
MTLFLFLQDVTNAFNAKIKDDAFRTFKGHAPFWDVVKEDTIIRVLRATALDKGYVQGMNVLLAPFLWIMPEFDGYLCFHRLVTHHIPSYITEKLEGVFRAIELTTVCLPVIDPTLSNCINKREMKFPVFSLRFILTMMANKPLDDVIHIWDAIFAYGAHFSIYIFFAYLISIRDMLFRKTDAFT